MFCNFRWV